ncbi:MAG TPA: DUF1236 domain-containing protein [Xanthobacteraceae bacterium]
MDKPARRCGFVAAVLLALAIGIGPAAAQGESRGSPDTGNASRDSRSNDAPAGTATDAPRNVPNLELSQSQRDTIYQSASNRQGKRDTAPVGFRPAVGAHVPDSIKLEPLPKTVVELVPKTVDYEYAFVDNQVLIVEPRSRTVVEVIH